MPDEAIRQPTEQEVDDALRRSLGSPQGDAGSGDIVAAALQASVTPERLAFLIATTLAHPSMVQALSDTSALSAELHRHAFEAAQGGIDQNALQDIQRAALASISQTQLDELGRVASGWA